MEECKKTCPSCGKEMSHAVLYRCISCFAVYCVECKDSQSGIRCPKCGQSGRMVLDQGKSATGA